MKRTLVVGLVVLAACSGSGSFGTARDVSVESVGGAGLVVRFTIDHAADCTILGHGIIQFPAGTNSYDVPAGTTLADDPVFCD